MLDLGVNFERSKAITYSVPIVHLYHSLFIKNPADKPSYTAFLEPLHQFTWLAMIGLILVSAPILWLAASTQEYDEDKKCEFTLAKSFVFCGGMISFGRPWSVVPKSGTAQFAFLW